MGRPEHFWVKLSPFPEDDTKHYKLQEKASTNGTALVEFNKGIYGLPQAGRISHQLLKNRLADHGCYQITLSPGLWKYDYRPTSLSLVVDNFGVKCGGKEHAKHLTAALKENYTVEVDEPGTKCCDIILNWDCVIREVHISMTGYYKEALKRFQHDLRKVMDQPHRHTE